MIVDELVSSVWQNGKELHIGLSAGMGPTSTNTTEYNWHDGESTSWSNWETGFPVAYSGTKMTYTSRKANGKWMNRWGWFKVPGVYILPYNYDDTNLYPDCDSSNFYTL